LIGTVTKLLSGILANPIGQWFVKLAFYISAATVALQLFAKSGLIAATRSLVMMVRQLFAGVGALKAFTASARAAKIAMGGFVAGALLVGLEALVTHIANARSETDKLKQSALLTADALRQMSMSQLLAEKRGQEAVLRATKQLREGYGGGQAPTKEQTRLAGVAGLEVTGRAGQRRIDMSMVGAVEQQAERSLAEIRHAISQSGQGVGGGAPSLQAIDLEGGGSDGGGTAGKGPQDITSNQLIVAEAINQKRREGNDLAVAHLEFAEELLDIQNSDLGVNQKAARLDKARTDHALKIEQINDNIAKEQQQALQEEQNARIKIQGIMLEAKLAAGAITQAEYETKVQLMGQAAVLKQMEKNGATPEQIAQMKGLQAGTPTPGSVEDLAKKAQDGLDDLINPVNQLETISTGVGEAFSTMFTDLATGAATAQEALGNMFNNLARMFADMVQEIIAQWVKVQLIQGLGNIFGAVAGGGGGGGLSMGSEASVDAMDQATLFNSSGGYIGGSLPQYANGGIVKGPTLGLIGEGRFNEAIVPLPNGKSIPVEMGKGMRGAVNSSVVVNINNGGNADSRTTGDQGNQLAKGIEGAVKQVIMREMRPGGMIASR
jgi:hypothetical protein